MSEGKLSGKVALVTGAGRIKGIGDACARRLSLEGAHVIVADLPQRRRDLEIEGIAETAHDMNHLHALAAELGASGAEAMAIALDVTDPAQCKAAIDAAIAKFGRLDILVNNAGTAVGAGAFLDLAIQAWDASWAVNVRGMVELIRNAIPHMQAQGGGAIVNVSSLLGLGAVPGYAGYVTTKFAVVGLTKAVAAEFGPDKIRCNAVCPGMIATLMGESEAHLIAAEHGVSFDEAKTLMAEPAALKRLGEADDVADVVAFLASEDARFVTGTAISVSGGMPGGL
ncbi:MAG: SDR family NAD(P)-dependent oxidoreductase [Sphingopyxis sp.]